MEFKTSDVLRFWAKVNLNGPIHPYNPALGNCWDWTAALSNGYGAFRLNDRNERAPAISYLLEFGIDPRPFCIHSCDRPSCVNPGHLRAGTPKDNADDMIARNRIATGERHGMRLHPECRARGEVHRSKMLVVAARGNNHVCAKITDVDVREIRLRFAAGGSTYKSIGIDYGLCRQSIALIVKLKNWKHVTEDSSPVEVGTQMELEAEQKRLASP